QQSKKLEAVEMLLSVNAKTDQNYQNFLLEQLNSLSAEALAEVQKNHRKAIELLLEKNSSPELLVKLQTLSPQNWLPFEEKLKAPEFRTEAYWRRKLVWLSNEKPSSLQETRAALQHLRAMKIPSKDAKAIAEV